VTRSWRDGQTRGHYTAAHIRRDREGRRVLPRVVERAPAPGDAHPLSKTHLRLLLPHVPFDYLYGLKRIELQPRRAAPGAPFGYYMRSERLIVVYSLPVAPWLVPAEYRAFLAAAAHFGAQVAAAGSECEVRWQSPEHIARYLWCEVLLHELGHHHDWQYRHKRKRPRGTRWNEASAELHSARLNRTHGQPLWNGLVDLGHLPDPDAPGGAGRG